MLCALYSAVSVSYTHLDVYKRQVEESIVSNVVYTWRRSKETQKRDHEETTQRGQTPLHLRQIFQTFPEETSDSRYIIQNIENIYITHNYGCLLYTSRCV